MTITRIAGASYIRQLLRAFAQALPLFNKQKLLFIIKDLLFGGLFLFLCVKRCMSDYSLPKVGASFQTAGSAIDPGTGRSVFITAIINGTDAVISDGVALSASDDIILGKNTNINFDPPLQVPAGETVTPKAGVTVGYFIGRATRTIAG